MAPMPIFWAQSTGDRLTCLNFLGLRGALTGDLSLSNTIRDLRLGYMMDETVPPVLKSPVKETCGPSLS